jgi:hypothetical protein
MNENRKPQARNLGNPIIDDESITDNVTSIDSLTAKSQWTFGKSSPTETIYDTLERELLPDSNYCKTIDSANEHLRAAGLAACWSHDDEMRYYRNAIKRDLLLRYTGAK